MLLAHAWSFGRWGVDTCCSRMLAVLIACWQVSCMLARSLAPLQSSAACRLQHDYCYYSPPPPPQPDDIIHVLTDVHIAHIGIRNFRLDYTRSKQVSTKCSYSRYVESCLFRDVLLPRKIMT